MSQQVVVITGASSGIGKATAELFAQKGCRVFGTTRHFAKVEAQNGVEWIEMDVGNEESVRKGVLAIIGKAQKIDVLVNNAGGSLVGALEESSILESEKLFNANVWGVLRVIQAVLPHMRKQGSGRIVNISSVLGFLPSPYMGVYAASKHALEGLSASLDHEVRQFGVRVTMVEPAYTKTQLDSNAPHAANQIDAYNMQRSLAASAIAKNIAEAPAPSHVAKTIVKAAFSAWKMRRTPSGLATLLSKLWPFMPAAFQDVAIRKTSGIA